MKKIFAIPQKPISKPMRVVSLLTSIAMFSGAIISDSHSYPLANTRASFYHEIATEENTSVEIEGAMAEIVKGLTEHVEVPVTFSTTVMSTMFTSSSDKMTKASSTVDATTTTSGGTTTSSTIPTTTTTTTTTTTSSTTFSTSSSTTTTSTTTTNTTTTSSTTTTSTTTGTEELKTTTSSTTTEKTAVDNSQVYYKPSTHYIHKSTCRWFDNTCKEIESTEGLECRRCSECHPDMEIVKEYVAPKQQQTTVTSNTTSTGNGGYVSLNYITNTERIYLCNVVASEYGADLVPIYDKAMIVCGIMNRVRDGGWTYGLPSTIYNVLMAPYQFNPAYVVPYYRGNVTQGCIDAVEYYFANRSIFPTYIHSWWGDGRYNHFS